jgi:hypothetical protein
MPRKDHRSVPIPKFFGKYAQALLEGEAGDAKQSRAKLKPLSVMLKPSKGSELSPALDWEAGSDWWPIRLLRRAAAKKDAEGYKRILYHVLIGLNVAPPPGVLTPFQGERGRPEQTGEIYAAWIAMGRPSTTWRVLEELAKVFYPAQFSKAKSDPTLRKNLRDRIRATIQRHESRATKSN